MKILLPLKLRLHTTINRPISYPGECDLIASPTKVHRHFLTIALLLPSYVYNMRQDTKSARLIAVCKRSFTKLLGAEYHFALEQRLHRMRMLRI